MKMVLSEEMLGGGRYSICLYCPFLLLTVKTYGRDQCRKDNRVDLKCKNYDGGFGSRPGSESHSGQIFCCVAALAIVDALHHVDTDLLAWWLCERQLKNGGLNGRPQKLEDVCYSWWVLSALSILDKVHWINKEKLSRFILSAQDPEEGGLADRPGDVADVFHTVFGIAGLSLLGYPGLHEVDPVYCMPTYVLQRIGLRR
ncbi:unnamed protein product [Rhizopus stolonifer]